MNIKIFFGTGRVVIVGNVLFAKERSCENRIDNNREVMR